MRALLVDDSNAMRRIQKNVLEKLGLEEVLEAGDGQEAIDKMLANKVDFVLLDWNMPNMNGLDALKNIRANAKIKDTKVIMCTSESEKAKIIEAVQAGASSYIVKPFTPEVLTEKLKSLKIL